jgi:hypothetical protein
MSYFNNTFYFQTRYLSNRPGSMHRLMAAQRQAMSSVQIGLLLLCGYVSFFTQAPKPVTSVLPNLKTTLVLAATIELLKTKPSLDFGADELWRAGALDRLRDVHGDGITIQFEEANTSHIPKDWVTANNYCHVDLLFPDCVLV